MAPIGKASCRDSDQLMTVIDMLDELRQALLETYHDDIGAYQRQRWQERQDNNDNLDMPDEDIPF